jgi:hypothetical protein
VFSQELYCETCDAVMLFEQPPCVHQHPDIVDYPDIDGSDIDGSELACTGCGESILYAPLTVLAINLHSRSRRVAPQQRRAA